MKIWNMDCPLAFRTPWNGGPDENWLKSSPGAMSSPNSQPFGNSPCARVTAVTYTLPATPFVFWSLNEPGPNGALRLRSNPLEPQNWIASTSGDAR